MMVMGAGGWGWDLSGPWANDVPARDCSYFGVVVRRGGGAARQLQADAGAAIKKPNMTPNTVS
jgi:hypothetical protein